MGVTAVPLFLKLVAAHLLGDYLFQSSRIAAEKRRPAMLALHVAVHALALVLVGLTEPPGARLWAALLLVLGAHAAIDAWTTRVEPRDLRALALDQSLHLVSLLAAAALARPDQAAADWTARSEEHTSELQSRVDLVCRLLLEKKKNVSSEFSSVKIEEKSNVNC